VEDRVEVMVKWPLSQLQYFPDIEKIPLAPARNSPHFC
jgi:hypothetical protein